MRSFKRLRQGELSYRRAAARLLILLAVAALTGVGYMSGSSLASPAYYYYYNVPQATLTVTKACEPTSDGGHFNLLVGAGTIGTDVACGGSAQTQLSAGTYTVSETAGSGTSLSNYETSIGGACDSQGSITLASGDNKTCTITNKRKPVLTVTKTCPNGKQSPGDRFEVVLNGSLTGRILDCGDTTTFVLAIGSNAAVTEAVPAGNTTTNLSNYKTSYSTDCSSTSLAAGATPTCTITNTLKPARSSALTPGYWKNHPSQLGALLPVQVGTFSVSSVPTANAILNAMNCGSSKDQDAVGCLAGQLLAAKLNVKNGASNCINPVIAQADALLIAINYQGPGNTYTLTPAQRSQLLSLKDALDKYNSGHGC